MNRLHTSLLSFLCLFLLISPIYAQQNQKTSTGGERQQEYYNRLHFPYGQLSPEQYDKMHVEIKRMKNEGGDAQPRRDGTDTDWLQDGPYGAKLGTVDKYYSGRIRDVEVTPVDEVIRIGAASGGLWEMQPDKSWICLSNEVTSAAIGSFDTNPYNDDIIIVGTGESSIRNGTGVWRTNNRGASWQQITISPNISSVRTLRYDPIDSSIVHMAAAQGYFRSNDGGRSWSERFGLELDDLTIDPLDPSRIYATARNNGLYRSTSGGDSLTWEKIIGPWDPALFGRSMVDACEIDPSVLFMSVTDRTDWRTEGVYTSVDTGTTWTRCFVANDDGSEGEYHWGQGWYNNFIDIHPQDCQRVFTGGGSVWQTLDGYEFSEIIYGHADNHRMTWNPDGSEGWLASDGGLFRSEGGYSWQNDDLINLLPIRQFTSFAISPVDNRIKGGGSQDNGVAISPNYTDGYLMNLGGDGGDVVFSRFAAEVIYATTGVYGGDLAFRRHYSNSQGFGWADINGGIEPCGQWWCNNAEDDNGVIYTHCGGKVYESLTGGVIWDRINSGVPGFAYDIWDMSMGYGLPGTLYACMSSSSSTRLNVLDRNTGQWENYSAGLPTDTYVSTVTPSYTEPDMAFALMGGVPASGDLGRKVFKTEDNGNNWVNVSGNIPNVPLTDIVVHPKDNDKLYACGDITCFFTEDGGLNWVEWGDGFPAHILVDEMDIADSLDINGHLWIYAATYGRSVWKRLIDEGPPPPPPSGLAALNLNKFEIYPNPSSGQFVVECEACSSADMQLDLFGLDGALKKSIRLYNSLSQVINVEGLSSGIYSGLISGNGELYRAKIAID
ncbi:MAG: photosystem II stability/assembly factor-like uncharacterized protein [Limisphaerales bacterium]|jgi:photosystem II stability/assembly factor-like uncharacterized protein